MTEDNSILKNTKKYGEKFQEHLLEQYKLYVEMTDRVSQRRAERNRYYITVLSVLLAIPSLIVALNITSEIQINFQKIIFMGISILGIVLCIFWSVNVHSYRKLNKAKFDIIIEMEDHLPYLCYKKEWERLEKGKFYLQLTTIEKIIPIILALPYIILLIYTIILLFS